MALHIENGILKSCTPEEGETSVTVPEGVTEIADGAFIQCDRMQRVRLPDSLTKIGQMAFLNCKALKAVTLPPKLVYLNVLAFEHGVRLTFTKFGRPFTVLLKQDWGFGEEDRALAAFLAEPCYGRFADISDADYAIPIAAAYQDTDEQIAAYLRERSIQAVLLAIDEEQISLLAALCAEGYVYPANIDGLLEYAIAHTQNGGSAEPQLMLMQFQEDKLGFRDAADRFGL